MPQRQTYSQPSPNPSALGYGLADKANVRGAIADGTPSIRRSRCPISVQIGARHVPLR